MDGSGSDSEHGCDFADGRSSLVHFDSFAPVEYHPLPA
jgi:hypothetical protein